MQTRKRTPQSVLIVLLAILLLAGWEGCQGSTPAPGSPTDTPVTSTDTPISPTDTPTDTPIPPTDMPTDTPIPPDEITSTPIPVIYALPDDIVSASPGPVYKVIPYNFPPSPWHDQPVIGQLEVKQTLPNVTPGLPTGTYTMTANGTDGIVTFSKQEGDYSTSAPAVIATLPTPIADDRPVALITASQICITSGITQVCAQVRTPLLPELQEVMMQTITNELEATVEWFALEEGVPDIEGVINDRMLDEERQRNLMIRWMSDCWENNNCVANVLAVPAKAEFQAVIPTPDVANLRSSFSDALLKVAAPAAVQSPSVNISATLAIKVLKDATEYICTNLECSKTKLDKLAKGAYVMYDIVLTTDPIDPATKAIKARVGLSKKVGATPTYYLPALVNAPYLPAMADTSQGTEAVITNLWYKHKSGKISCYFKWWQCPKGK